MSLSTRFLGIVALLGIVLVTGCQKGSEGGADKTSANSPSGDGGAASTGITGEITRVSRQNNSGTYEYFREAVLGKEREFGLGTLDMSGSKDVVEMVAKTPSAIGYSGMGYATNEVRMVPVSKDGTDTAVSPTVENAKNKTYPLSRALYIYSVGEPSGAVKHYLEWILSAEGQAVVEKIGYVPLEPKPMTTTDAPPAATIKVGGSDTMVNLAQAWAEEYNKKYTQVEIQVGGGGSGVGIAQITDGKIELANSSREMKADEKAKIQGQLIETMVAYDALAIYVHKNNPIASISLKDLAEIYGDEGTITEWSQVGQAK